MEVKCPNCGNLVMIKGIGRKPLPIPTNIVSSALQYHLRGRLVGKPHYLNTSKEIYRLLGVKVSGGFVQWRLQKEARDKGITYDELLAQLMTKGKMEERLARMKKVMQGGDAPPANKKERR